MSTRHFSVSVLETDEGFSVEAGERLAMTRGRAVLLNRESVTNTPEEIGDVVREAIVSLLYPPPEPDARVSQR